MIIAVLVLALAAAADSAPIPAAADSVQASAVPDSVLLLPEVRVDRERLLSEARRRLPTGFTSDLKTGTSGRAVETLSEVLNEAAGVHVDQYGGLGAFSTVSLRGAAAGQVTVYLDGVPLTSAAHGEVNLADLPITAVERVEVYRGLAPLALGVATPGGAINLVTTSVPGATGVRDLRVARGSFGTWEARGTAGARRGTLSAVLHAGYQGSDGDFRYFDDNGTAFTTADDSTSTRANNQFDAATVIGTVVWAPRAGLKLLAREDLFRKAQGIPGVDAVVAHDTRLDFLRSLSHVALSLAGTRLRPTLRVRGSLDEERTRNLDKLGELGSGQHDTNDRLSSADVSLGLDWEAPGGWLALESAGLMRREHADLTDAADGQPDPPQSRRITRGAMLGVRLRPLGDRLTLHGAKRWDRIEDQLISVGVAGLPSTSDVSRELDAPQLGARLVGPLGLEARANWTQASRAPTFDELFGRAGSIVGSPDLRPERAENWDAGFAWARAFGAHKRAAFEWAHFASRAEDLVLYERVFQFVRPRNIARAQIRGDELSLTFGAGALSAAGSFTWQSAIDQSPIPFWYGKRLALRPGRQAFGRLAWRARTIQLGATLQYIGDNYLNPSNRDRVASRSIAGASIAVTPFGHDLALTVEGKNLGDNRIADVGGYPLPGRSIFVSCGFSSASSGSAQP
jgi:iron complex outermembrane receptor protein